MPTVAVTDGVLRVTDTGDFFIVGDDTLVTHRCLLVRKQGGAPVFGVDPGKSTPVDRPPPGSGTRDEVAAFRVALAAGTYEWFVWGGVHSRYVRADGTVAYDVFEWGNYDLSHPERVAKGTVTVGTPPPSVKPLTWYRDQALRILDEAVRVHGAAVSDSTRVRHMLRVGRTSDAKRKLVDGALDKIGV